MENRGPANLKTTPMAKISSYGYRQEPLRLIQAGKDNLLLWHNCQTRDQTKNTTATTAADTTKNRQTMQREKAISHKLDAVTTIYSFSPTKLPSISIARTMRILNGLEKNVPAISESFASSPMRMNR